MIALGNGWGDAADSSADAGHLSFFERSTGCRRLRSFPSLSFL
jgi:hypothetical protein